MLMKLFTGGSKDLSKWMEQFPFLGWKGPAHWAERERESYWSRRL